MHSLYLAYTAIKRTFSNLEYCFSLVVQLCANVPTGIVITFIQMQYRMDMQIVHTGPPHQVIDKLYRLTGIVDVVHKITNPVNHYKPDIRICIQCKVNDLSSVFG